MKESLISTKRLIISKTKIIFFSLFFIALLFCNPLSLNRFQVATYYFPILIYLKIFRTPYAFFIFFIISILYITNFLNFFRYHEFSDYNINNFFNLDHLSAGHFDAYQNITVIIENNFISNGSNLLSAIFWFIPRSIFESKNIGSGEIIANLLNYNFSNIAVSFLAEGYVAFGLFGVFLFALFLGIVVGNLDQIAWSFIFKNKKTTFLYYYYFLFGQIFILLRGDLLSGFSFFMSFALTFIFVLLVFKIKQF
jgi:hypothetical protein